MERRFIDENLNSRCRNLVKCYSASRRGRQRGLVTGFEGGEWESAEEGYHLNTPRADIIMHCMVMKIFMNILTIDDNSLF